MRSARLFIFHNGALAGEGRLTFGFAAAQEKEVGKGSIRASATPAPSPSAAAISRRTKAAALSGQRVAPFRNCHAALRARLSVGGVARLRRARRPGSAKGI